MAVPTLISSTVGATGLTLTMVWSEPVGDQGLALLVKNNYRSLSTGYSAVSSPGASLVYTLTGQVYAGETVTVFLPAGQVLSVSTSDPNASNAAATTTNNSAVTPPGGGMASGLMNGTCTIRRNVRTQSATSAGIVNDWGVAYAGISCSAQAVTGSEAEVWMREVGDSIYRIYMPPVTDILHSDRLTAFTHSSSLGSSDILEVVSEPLDHAGRGNVYTMVFARPMEANA